MRTKARIRGKRHERIHRQASDRIGGSLSADQRRILAFSREGWQPTEIARELALSTAYVSHFMAGLVQRLIGEGLIGSPDWRNVLKWAAEQGVLAAPER